MIALAPQGQRFLSGLNGRVDLAGQLVFTGYPVEQSGLRFRRERVGLIQGSSKVLRRFSMRAMLARFASGRGSIRSDRLFVRGMGRMMHESGEQQFALAASNECLKDLIM